MVHLSKIPSEFSASRMRDSFLKQFLEQDAEVEVGPPGDFTGSQVALEAAKQLRAPMLSKLMKSRASNVLRKNYINMIIR